jgi:hypothetical protein
VKVSSETMKLIDKAVQEGRVTERRSAPLPDAPPPPANISEADFTSKVIAHAQEHGWRCAHFRPARTKPYRAKDGTIKQGWRTAVQGDGEGFPDLLMVRGERGLVAELKSAKGKVTKEQRDWLAAFEFVGWDTFIWTPAAWPEIVQVLR